MSIYPDQTTSNPTNRVEIKKPFPGIEISPGVPVNSERVSQYYTDARGALFVSFGTAFPIDFVQRISFRDYGKSPAHAGVWRDHQNIQIYWNGIQFWNELQEFEETPVKINWKVVLAHELGHAFHASIVGKHRLQIINTTAKEAFADFVCGHIRRQDGQHYNTAVDTFAPFSNPNHRLFESDLDRFYPNPLPRIEDAAILNFIFSRYGLSTGLRILTLIDENKEYEPYYRKSMDGVDKATKKKIRAQASKRYSQFQEHVQDLLGCNLRELSSKSDEMYRNGSRYYRTAPPTLAQGLRNLWYKLPYIKDLI